MFAKLFKTKIGQILVKVDADDEDQPEIRVYFKPKDMGVCNIAVQFKDFEGITESGWKAADKALESMTEERAIQWVKSTSNEFNVIQFDEREEPYE